MSNKYFYIGVKLLGDGNEKDTMLEVFIFETTQQLTQLEDIALQTETENSIQGQINEVFRIVHTMKGSSAFMNYEKIVVLTHSLEDVFYYIRENRPAGVNYSLLADIILKSIDFIKLEITCIQCAEVSDFDVTELVNRVNAFLDGMSNKEEGGSPEAGNVKAQVVEDETVFPSPEEKLYKAVIFFDEGCEMENVRAFNVIFNLEKYVNIINYIPHDIIDRKETAEIIQKNGFEINFSANLDAAEVENILSKTLFIKEIKLETAGPEPTDQKTVELNQPEIAVGADNIKQSMISVNLNKMDRLMDLVGELVISQAMVVQNPELEGLPLNSFIKASRQLQLVTNEIQDAVMSLRMVPLNATFKRMNRIVRDMSIKLNKKIKLNVIGEDTEVDKNIIEHLSDPLLHLIRNAADHGIEAENDRIKAGKSPIGTITIEAKSEGQNVRIVVRDDGKGLNREKIIKKAKRQGLLRKPENELTDREIHSLIFLPGFSTADNITEFSGRGVGMDVVNKSIEDIGGTIQIDSCEGQYTLVSIKIPLTLAIIDGMKIRVGKSIYIIPITVIRESFCITDNKVICDEASKSEMIMIRGSCCPILRLNQFFKITSDAERLEDGVVIVVENETKVMCLFADELMGKQQVVIKALPPLIKKRKGISSCTVIGNGNVSLIIDVPSLFESI